ncbi:hypothetical protein AB0L70_16350 [Kribbella sp. NPDC051952]|uniref:RNA polymerase sigma factor n=1 Tax=Kribbella sp. NPDC051952 TaxID=3154851 RepID=UPI00341AD99B
MSDEIDSDDQRAPRESPPGGLTEDDYRSALLLVRAFVSRRFRGLAPQDVEDIASDAMVRLLRLKGDGQLDLENNPSSYLMKLAEWTATDFLRSRIRRQREVLIEPDLLPESPHTDDDVAAALDGSATAQIVRAALSEARQVGDHTAYVVVTRLLDEVDRTGSRPSNRELGRKIDVSHTAVAKALVRFQSYMKLADGDP